MLLPCVKHNQNGFLWTYMNLPNAMLVIHHRAECFALYKQAYPAMVSAESDHHAACWIAFREH